MDGNDSDKKWSLRRTLTTSAAISVVALIASCFIPGELTSLEVFIPKEKASDFSFSDFYTLAANNAEVVETDPDITIVALDGCNRAAMGRAIAFADSCGAAVIGLDLVFSPPTIDHDSIIAAIDTAYSVVLPTILTGEADGRFTGAEVSYFEPMLSGLHEHGAVNINGSLENSTTRYFKAEFDLGRNTIPALSTVIAEIYRPGSAYDLMSRESDMELINYSNRVFNILTPGMMPENTDLLKDRIILMGYLDDPADMHRTPLVNKTPGILIHANTIATIINGEYISRSSRWLSVAVALAACFMMVFAGIHFRFRPWGAILVRAVQVLLMVGVLYLGSIVFIRFNYSFDFMPTITVTILGLVVMDIVIGLSYFAFRAYNFILGLPAAATKIAAGLRARFDKKQIQDHV